SRRLLALPLTRASRGSSRVKNAASISPAGNKAGRSFDECTATSMAPASKASSISLVNSPLPPASAKGLSWSGLSWILSPLVRMTSILMASGATPHALAMALCAWRAWTSASGEPREPMRRMEVGVEDCLIGRLYYTDVDPRHRDDLR